jgi:hypothetical protein
MKHCSRCGACKNTKDLIVMNVECMHIQPHCNEKLLKRIVKRISLILLSTTALAAQTHTATLNWTDTQNPTGTTYNIYRATGLCSGSPVFSKLATAITVKTYNDTSVTVGNYCFQVTATFSGAESTPSNNAPLTELPFPPASLTVQ